MEEKLSLARIYYPVTVLGPGQRVGIWLNGCSRGCRGCVSPELMRYDAQKEFSAEDIEGMILSAGIEPEGFTISGGEPFYHPKALNELLKRLESITDDIIVFTGYRLSELEGSGSEAARDALRHISVLIDGPYEESLNDGKGLRGSSNQKIHIFRHPERYSALEDCERKLQTVYHSGNLFTIGIPGTENDQSI